MRGAERGEDLCVVFRVPGGIRKHRHPGSQLLRVLVCTAIPLLSPLEAWVRLGLVSCLWSGDRSHWAVASAPGAEACSVELGMGAQVHSTSSAQLSQASSGPASGLYPPSALLLSSFHHPEGAKAGVSESHLESHQDTAQWQDGWASPATLRLCLWDTQEASQSLGPSVTGLPGSLTASEIARLPQLGQHLAS